MCTVRIIYVINDKHPRSFSKSCEVFCYRIPVNKKNSMHTYLCISYTRSYKGVCVCLCLQLENIICARYLCTVRWRFCVRLRLRLCLGDSVLCSETFNGRFPSSCLVRSFVRSVAMVMVMLVVVWCECEFYSCPLCAPLMCLSVCVCVYVCACSRVKVFGVSRCYSCRINGNYRCERAKRARVRFCAHVFQPWARTDTQPHA